jgi:predicted transposase/invertase (TIGR01784 family)
MQEETRPRIGRFINALSDMGFKLIFSDNKEMLISFLNALFQGRKQIIDLTYNNTEKRGPQKRYRGIRYDLTCTDQDGVQFILEMQRVKQDFFRDRAVYYTSSLIQEKGPKGKKNWDFQLPEVYFIGLMEFTFDDSLPDDWLHRASITDENTGRPLYQKLGFVFIEIPKFNKAADELTTDLDRWSFLLKNLGHLEKIPVALRRGIFKTLFKITEVANLTKEQYMLYQRDLKAKWNEYANLTTARNEGIEAGKVRGKAEAEKKSKTEFVKNLLMETRFTVAKIARLASVTEDFVEKVKLTLS